MSTPASEHRTEAPLRVLRRHLPSAIVALAAIWLLVSLAAFALPVTYSASATVQVYPVAGGQAANATNVTPVNVSTEARVASSDTVMEAAAASLGGTDAAALRRGVQVEAPDGSQNLVVVGTAASPEAAASRANAVAEAYLKARGEMAASVVRSADAKLTGLIERWKNDPALKGRIGELELSRAQLAQVNTVPGSLVDPALASGATASGRAVWGVAAGFVLGLLGAAAAVLWRERTSRSCYDAERLAARTSRRVLDWDGDAEGVRRFLLGEQAAAAWTLTGDGVASRRFAYALAAGLRERGKNVDRVHLADAATIDEGRAERALLRAAARGGVVATVDPDLGFSRFVRLSRHARPVLVVTKRSRIDVVQAALGDLPDGATLVFASSSALRAPAPEPDFATAADRALAFERAARQAQSEPGPAEEPAGDDAAGARARGTATGRGSHVARPDSDRPADERGPAPEAAERELVVALAVSTTAAAAGEEAETPSAGEPTEAGSPDAEARRGGDEA